MQRVLSEARYKDSFPLPQKTDPNTYIKSNDLILAALKQAGMVRVFSSLHAGQSSIKIDNLGQHRISFGPEYDLRYSALEVLNHGQERTLDVTTLVFRMLRGVNDDLELGPFFDSSTRMRKGRIVYRYEVGGLHRLSQIIPQRAIVIPDSFTFTWGCGRDTQALINSLLLRCAYHILCIDFAVQKFRIPGGFESSLVLSLSKDELINDLAYFADFGEERIAQFIDFLTLGQSTDSPDLALQPLVRTANGQYMLPCKFILCSDLQRNILSLMARVQKNDFDKQSAQFEKGMIGRLIDASSRWPTHEDNKTFRAAGQKEEIDLLLVDRSSKLMLAFECAWMLRPGDPREVFNRLSTCAKKVDQIERKRNFLRDNLREILQARSLDSDDADQWTVEGLVVIEGFGGQLSRVADLPIISLSALKIGFAECETLPGVFHWACSLEWLPQPASHFVPSDETHETQPVQIHRPGFLLTDGSVNYVDHIRQTARHAEQKAAAQKCRTHANRKPI